MAEEPAEDTIGETGRLLDGFLLLASGGFSLPDDAVVANLCSLDIVEISDDLRFFPNLDSLDVSDNKLNYKEVLEHIFVAPRITKLNLSCNQIGVLNCRRNPIHYQSCFYSLTTLDLSFNELHGDVLIALAVLPKLEHLNLSANCVSSIPPEESLEGFPMLEELILDSNDLVQFDQWRSLDCISKLKKLGLASNRIKRMKDDISHGSGDIFSNLEEIDLRGNDIGELDSLSLVLSFKSLQRIKVSRTDLPKYYEHIKIEATKVSSWYMQGNGSFAARHKRLERKERPRRSFRQVNEERPKDPKTGDNLPSYGRGGSEIINEPLKNAPLINSNHELQQALYADAVLAANEASLAAELGSQRFRIPPVDLIGSDCEEALVDEIFRRRRKQIDSLVEEIVSQEPVKNFMRPIPFALSDQSVRILREEGGAEHDKTFLTQDQGQITAETFFSKYTDDELLQTPRTPLELRQQQMQQDKIEQRRLEEHASHINAPAVDVPIDVRRSLEALRDAMGRGDDMM